MKPERRYKKRKIKIRRRSTFNDQFTYIIIITVICAIVAFGVAFFTGRVPSVIDDMIQRHIEKTLPETMKGAEEEIIKRAGEENIDNLLKKYKEKAKSSR